MRDNCDLRAKTEKARGNAAEKPFDVWRRKLEAGDAVAHRVRKAAGAMHDRQRAHSLREHLAEAAWLEPRGHEQEVAASVHAPRQFFIVAREQAQCARMPSESVAQVFHDLRIALADHRDLAAMIYDFLGRLGDVVDALLVDEARYDDEQWAAGVFKSERLANCLCVEVSRAPVPRLELRREVGIGRRVPRSVDAVDDTGEAAFGSALAQHAVQPAAMLLSRDFTGVVCTDRGDVIGVHKARLHEG